jgi:hypothetical protein
LSEPLTRAELASLAEEGYGEMVKAVVDVGRDRMAVGGELHSDEEAELLEVEDEATRERIRAIVGRWVVD